MSKWSLKDITSQQGKVAVVTGANSGIGYETTLGLAKKNVEVVMACRNMSKAEKARADILEECPNLTILHLDTSSLVSVKRFAQDFREAHERLDILINNAGIMMSPYEVTQDGFENQLATNYIGHFALTGMLLPLLTNTDGSRILTLTSKSYNWSEIQFDDLHFEKKYSKTKAYGQSKRACLMFAYELQRRLNKAGHSTRSVAVHPGLAKTNLDKHFPALIRPLGALFLQKAEKGALSVLYASLSERIKGGELIGPDGFQEMRGSPTQLDSDDYSKDKKIAERLWQLTEDMTEVQYLNQTA